MVVISLLLILVLLSLLLLLVVVVTPGRVPADDRGGPAQDHGAGRGPRARPHRLGL